MVVEVDKELLDEGVLQLVLRDRVGDVLDQAEDLKGDQYLVWVVKEEPGDLHRGDELVDGPDHRLDVGLDHDVVRLLELRGFQLRIAWLKLEALLIGGGRRLVVLDVVGELDQGAQLLIDKAEVLGELSGLAGQHVL